MRASHALINLNTATARELTQLPRIGADKARRIVHYRAVRKRFRDWADFARTPGITQADVEAIQARACIGPPAEGNGGPGDRRPRGRDPESEAATGARSWRWVRARAKLRSSRPQNA